MSDSVLRQQLAEALHLYLCDSAGIKEKDRGESQTEFWLERADAVITVLAAGVLGAADRLAQACAEIETWSQYHSDWEGDEFAEFVAASMDYRRVRNRPTERSRS